MWSKIYSSRKNIPKNIETQDICVVGFFEDDYILGVNEEIIKFLTLSNWDNITFSSLEYIEEIRLNNFWEILKPPLLKK